MDEFTVKAAHPDVSEFLRHLADERQQSPHTVKAYARDLDSFVEFLGRHSGGDWSWETVDRLAIRGFLGEMQRRGLAKRSAARALSAVRSFFRYRQVHHGLESGVARAAKVPRIEKRLPTYLDRGRTDDLFAAAEARAAEMTSRRCATSRCSSSSIPPACDCRNWRA